MIDSKQLNPDNHIINKSLNKSKTITEQEQNKLPETLYSYKDKFNLQDMMTSVAVMNSTAPRMQKAHTGPPVKIRCKCAHAQRYHLDAIASDGTKTPFAGACPHCTCKEFRHRPENQEK
jgi:hypothetical protein